MVQILRGEIVLQEVEHDLNSEELQKAKGSAVLTNKGWILVDLEGRAYLMHIIAYIKPKSNDWVYDYAKGPIKVTMVNNVPSNVGKVKITNENIGVISELPGFENSELKVGKEIELVNDLSNKPVILRTTKKVSSQNFPGEVSSSFLANFILKNFKIDNVMIHVKRDQTEILWDNYL